jgi:Ca-activated chloride channel family protein
MKPFLPFALLGSVGVAGALVGTGGMSSSTSTPATPPTPPTTATTDLGAVRVEASLERTHLPANTSGETFARVALIGRAAQEKKSGRAPVSLTLVIDRSGSMGSEQKMDAAEDAACRALQELQAGDRYAVVSFDNGADVLVDDAFVKGGAADTVQSACFAIKNMSARGGTDMRSGLGVGGDRALAIAGEGRVNRLLLLSDGQPDTADGLAARAAELARRGITTTTIGLGTDYNEDLMASIADQGMGNSYFVESRTERGGGTQQLAKIFETELKSMAEVVAQNTSITLTPQQGLEIVNVIGFASDKSNGATIIPVGDIYAGRTIDVLVKVRHPVSTAGLKELLGVDVSFNEPAAKSTTTHLAVNATFTLDAAAVTASTVPSVAVKALEWNSSQALLLANDAFNNGDFDKANTILNEQKAAVTATQGRFKGAKLDGLLSEMDSYQASSNAGGMGTRAEMNKKAKAVARDVSRATGTYVK